MDLPLTNSSTSSNNKNAHFLPWATPPIQPLPKPSLHGGPGHPQQEWSLSGEPIRGLSSPAPPSLRHTLPRELPLRVEPIPLPGLPAHTVPTIPPLPALAPQEQIIMEREHKPAAAPVLTLPRQIYPPPEQGTSAKNELEDQKSNCMCNLYLYTIVQLQMRLTIWARYPIAMVN